MLATMPVPRSHSKSYACRADYVKQLPLNTKKQRQQSKGMANHHETYGCGSQPRTPGEHQNRWFSPEAWRRVLLLKRLQTSQANCTRSLHKPTAQAHFTSQLHKITSQANYTSSLHKPTAQAHFTSQLHKLTSQANCTRSLHKPTTQAHFTSQLHKLTSQANCTRVTSQANYTSSLHKPTTQANYAS